MFEITVFKLMSDKFAKAQASHRQVLVDHLEAGGDRNGFVITWDGPEDLGAYKNETPSGSLWRDGREVAVWKIEEVKA